MLERRILPWRISQATSYSTAEREIASSTMMSGRL
jgi:hypothetical protein